MLDADEAAAFDEAMRHDPELKVAYHEMDRLSAAVAVTATFPIAPQAGQLERLHLRLGINAAKHANWLGITGWAAAAVLAMVLILDRSPDRRDVAVERAPSEPVSRQQESVVAPPAPRVIHDKNPILTSPPEGTAESGMPTNRQDEDAGAIAKVETRRLIQEIEVLREKLEGVTERDRKRFEPVPGMAWPIVVRMRPPEKFVESPLILAMRLDEPTITSVLGGQTRVCRPTTGIKHPGWRVIRLQLGLNSDRAVGFHLNEGWSGDASRTLGEQHGASRAALRQKCYNFKKSEPLPVILIKLTVRND